jgi:hypothetical protein
MSSVIILVDRSKPSAITLLNYYTKADMHQC